MDNPIINYRIAGIELVHKQMVQMPLTANGASTKFLFDITVEVKVNAEHKLVIPFVKVKIRGGSEEAELASIGVSCLFEVEGFDKHIVINEQGLYTVPPSLENAIRPIAISTARGVMFSEFSGSYLHNAVLPIVSINPMNIEQVQPKKEDKV